MQLTRQREELRRQGAMKWRIPRIVGCVIAAVGLACFLYFVQKEDAKHGSQILPTLLSFAATVVGGFLALVAWNQMPITDRWPWSQQRLEQKCIEEMMLKLLEQNKDRFLSESDLSGNDFNLKDYNPEKISAPHVEFEIEPEKREPKLQRPVGMEAVLHGRRHIATGTDGVQWVSW